MVISVPNSAFIALSWIRDLIPPTGDLYHWGNTLEGLSSSG